MLRIGIVAGEASGDFLGANLINSIRAQRSDISVEGVAGPCLAEAGCKVLFPMEKLSVMGLVEVLGSYRNLLKLRRQLIKHFIDNPPDVFIGVDAPDFNLDMEGELRGHGIRVVHYVSPSVWAWRSYRVKKIRRCVDLILALFPFEKEFYEQHDVPVCYVGHPLAEKIPLQPDRLEARRALALNPDKKVIAILPGSRKSELKRLVSVFLETASSLQKPDLQFASSLLNEESLAYCRAVLKDMDLSELDISFYQGRAGEVLQASDYALVASGTITLEAMLYKCPMVVAYKLNWLTHKLVLATAKVKHAALPNLLSSEYIVPECLQSECYPENLTKELKHLVDEPGLCKDLEEKFTQIHRQLKMESGRLAADAVLSLLDK